MGNNVICNNEKQLVSDKGKLQQQSNQAQQQKLSSYQKTTDFEKYQIKELIKQKNKGEELTSEMIQYWIKGIQNQTIPDYQTASLLMAIFHKGMNLNERKNLTQGLINSGKKLDLSQFNKFAVDKLSIEGLGDKTSIMLSPLMACCGLLNPMIIGREINSVGNTVDKLETITGYKTQLKIDDLMIFLQNQSAFIVDQTEDIVPVEKILYQMRESSETLDEISLTTSSYLSKKLTENLKGLTLDIKCGSGTQCKNIESARDIGNSMIQTCKELEVKCEGLIFRQDYPIGCMVGNTIEVWEAIEALNPNSEYGEILKNNIEFDQNAIGYVKLKECKSPKDSLILITMALAINMMTLKNETPENSFTKIKDVWLSGLVLQKLKDMIKQQQGEYTLFQYKAAKIKQHMNNNSSNVYVYKSPKNCKIESISGDLLKDLMLELGAGRKKFNDAIEQDASLEWNTYPNQQLNEGDVICKLYHPKNEKFVELNVQYKLDNIIKFAENEQFVDEKPIIIERLFQKSE